MVVADPAVSDTAPDAACEATVTVCTVTVAPVEVTVGVTVTDATGKNNTARVALAVGASPLVALL